MDDAALGHYLRWGYIPAPLTIYRGCEKLPPVALDAREREGTRGAAYSDPNMPPASGSHARLHASDDAAPSSPTRFVGSLSPTFRWHASSGSIRRAVNT
jgi:hypothetical protein